MHPSPAPTSVPSLTEALDAEPNEAPHEVPRPFALDLEDLESIASKAAVRAGVAAFRENCVIELDWGADWLDASAESGSIGSPWLVTIRLQESGPQVECDCEHGAEPVCEHAVAALLAASARAGLSERGQLRREEVAIEERRVAGAEHVSVRHVDGDRWFGTWTASSEALHGKRARTWRVQIRSVGERLNHCDCPDWSSNRLGTCKHVEAVLHRLRKRAPRKFERLAAAPPPIAVVALDTASEHAPRPHLERGPSNPELEQLVEPFFDTGGRWRGELPDGVFALQQVLRGRDDVVLGDEVVEHARLLADEERHRARAAALRAELRRNGGRVPGLRATLYPYQVDGVAHLVGRGRAVLADDMGLGKTLQSIAACHLLMERGDAAAALVLCPASLKAQWAREIQRFTGRSVQIVQGSALARREQWARRAEFTIANYELLRRDHEVVPKELAPDILVLDEAQRIRNWRTRTADLVKRVQTRFAFVLTGTPLENRLEDLYSLMQAVDPRILGPLWQFHRDFHVLGLDDRVVGYRNLGELRRRLAPVLLRRDRSLVRDQLPARIQQQIDVELSKAQRHVMDDAVDSARRLASIRERRPLTPVERNRLMSALQRARMACNALGLVDKETQGSPKLDELRRLLDELAVQGGRKVVVFSEWERMTAMAATVATDLGLGCVRLHGSVPSGRRGEIIRRFSEDDDVRVFLSTDAGSTGLNLQAASVLINLDLPWNPAVLEQRIARIHRLGQREPAHVLLLVAEDSYEGHVAGLLAGKAALFGAAVGEDGVDELVAGGGALAAVLAAMEGEATGADEGAAALVAPDERAGGEAGSAGEAGPDEAATDEAATDEAATDEASAELDAPAPAEQLRADRQDRRAATAADRAARRFGAAEHLLEAGFTEEALELAVQAALAAVAARAHVPVPALDGAAVWLFAQAVPSGLVQPDEAAPLAQALALSAAPSIPRELGASSLAALRRLSEAAGSPR